MSGREEGNGRYVTEGMKMPRSCNLCLIHSLRIIHIADARRAGAASPTRKHNTKVGAIRCEARIVDCTRGSVTRRSILK